MTPPQRVEYEALRAQIAMQMAHEHRLIQRCRALIQPLLSVTGFEARLILYPRESPVHDDVTDNAEAHR